MFGRNPIMGNAGNTPSMMDPSMLPPTVHRPPTFRGDKKDGSWHDVTSHTTKSEGTFNDNRSGTSKVKEKDFYRSNWTEVPVESCRSRGMSRSYDERHMRREGSLPAGETCGYTHNEDGNPCNMWGYDNRVATKNYFVKLSKKGGGSQGVVLTPNPNLSRKERKTDGDSSPGGSHREPKKNDEPGMQQESSMPRTSGVTFNCNFTQGGGHGEFTDSVFGLVQKFFDANIVSHDHLPQNLEFRKALSQCEEGRLVEYWCDFKGERAEVMRNTAQHFLFQTCVKFGEYVKRKEQERVEIDKQKDLAAKEKEIQELDRLRQGAAEDYMAVQRGYKEKIDGLTKEKNELASKDQTDAIEEKKAQAERDEELRKKVDNAAKNAEMDGKSEKPSRAPPRKAASVASKKEDSGMQQESSSPEREAWGSVTGWDKNSGKDSQPMGPQAKATMQPKPGQGLFYQEAKSTVGASMILQDGWPWEHRQIREEEEAMYKGVISDMDARKYNFPAVRQSYAPFGKEILKGRSDDKGMELMRKALLESSSPDSPNGGDVLWKGWVYGGIQPDWRMLPSDHALMVKSDSPSTFYPSQDSTYCTGCHEFRPQGCFSQNNLLKVGVQSKRCRSCIKWGWVTAVATLQWSP